MKKKKTSDEIMEDYCHSIRKEINRWKNLEKNGGSDPFWADGYNLNLVRNHIIYYKGKICELCNMTDMALPEEYYLPTPPKVDDHYMANFHQKERVTRLRSFGQNLIHKKIRYDDQQTSLF